MKHFKMIIFNCCLISALQGSIETNPSVNLKDTKNKTTKPIATKQPKVRIKSKANEKPFLESAAKTSKKVAIGLVIGAYVHHVLNNSQDFTQPDFSIGTLRKDQERFKATAMNTCYSLNNYQKSATKAFNSFIENDKNLKEKIKVDHDPETPDHN